MEVSWDLDTTPQPGPRDLTLMGSLDELRELYGSRNNGLPLEEVLRHLHESKSRKDIEDIERATRDQAKSSLWMRHRVGMITASIAYSVYTRVKTLTTKMGPHDARPLLKKIFRQTNVRTAAMRRGSDLEGPAKKCYERKHSQHEGLLVRGCGLFVMEGRPYIGASPDGLVECKCCANRVLEVKCPEKTVKFLQENTEKCTDITRIKLKHTSTHFCQVQVQMGLAGVKHGDLFVYISDEDNVCISVDFDEEFFKDVVDRSSYFFEKYVLPHILG